MKSKQHTVIFVNSYTELLFHIYRFVFSDAGIKREKSAAMRLQTHYKRRVKVWPQLKFFGHSSNLDCILLEPLGCPNPSWIQGICTQMKERSLTKRHFRHLRKGTYHVLLLVLCYLLFQLLKVLSIYLLFFLSFCILTLGPRPTTGWGLRGGSDIDII